ncbi:MAG: DUF3597 domain-containing protein [Chthoniobacterales bacterium]
MKLFNTLMSKIFSHASAPAQTTSATAGASTQPTAGAPAQTAASAGSTPPSASNAPAASGGAAAAPANVDVDAVLTQMAAKNPERLDWKKSIVDLMKLVGMESSLQNRKELATELGYTGDMNDSASMNIWLHKAVLRKLAENGGRVPKELID